MGRSIVEASFVYGRRKSLINSVILLIAIIIIFTTFVFYVDHAETKVVPVSIVSSKIKSTKERQLDWVSQHKYQLKKLQQGQQDFNLFYQDFLQFLKQNNAQIQLETISHAKVTRIVFYSTNILQKQLENYFLGCAIVQLTNDEGRGYKIVARCNR